MANVYKCYWQGKEASAADVGAVVRLSEAESRHLVKVFRARGGDAVILFDGQGNLWRGILALADSRAAQVKIERRETADAPRPRITLGQAMPKGKTMDSVIAAMVELGVAAIVPLASDHSEVRLEKDPARAESKREHWQQTSIEASKQSSNFYGTRIAPICSLKTFLHQLDRSSGQSESAHPHSHATAAAADSRPVAASDVAVAVDSDAAGDAVNVNATANAASGGGGRQLRIIGSLEQGSVPLASLAAEIEVAEEVVCLIGPEGDFSAAEYSLARQSGFRPVRLASHVLRVKTAATYIVSTVDALARVAR